MELDDLKSAWTELERAEAPARPSFDPRIKRTRTGLHRVAWMLCFELASNALAALMLGSFLSAHWRTPRFVIPALVLQEYALLTVVITAIQLALLARVDLAAPVVTLQRRVARLTTVRLWTTFALLVLSPMLWAPLSIVLAKGLLGLDVFQAFGARWVWGNLAAGLAVIPLGLWIARRMARRVDRAGRLPGWVDLLTGRSLAEARRDADELARFAAEG
jgi:hypothetical protein